MRADFNKTKRNDSKILCIGCNRLRSYSTLLGGFWRRNLTAPSSMRCTNTIDEKTTRGFPELSGRVHSVPLICKFASRRFEHCDSAYASVVRFHPDHVYHGRITSGSPVTADAADQCGERMRRKNAAHPCGHAVGLSLPCATLWQKGSKWHIFSPATLLYCLGRLSFTETPRLWSIIIPRWSSYVSQINAI